MHFNRKLLVVALSNVFSRHGIAKTEFRLIKFRGGWTTQVWYKVSLLGQTGREWVQLLPHPLLWNSKIVCHLAELNGVQNSAKKADIARIWLILQAKCASYLSRLLTEPMVSCFYVCGFSKRRGSYFSECKIVKNANLNKFRMTKF